MRGVPRLSGAPVRAHDIRAGAAMVVAGLAAEGETVISGVAHIDRGYDDLVGRLASVGADIDQGVSAARGRQPRRWRYVPVMADLEFFFDPICPWAWITSRLTVEVADQRDLAVDWRFICLRMVNEEQNYDSEFPPGYVNAHTPATMLRIAGRGPARRRERRRWPRSYTAFGEQLHTAGRSEEIRDGDDSVIGEAVEDRRPPARARRAAGDDEALDDVVREETDLALSGGPARTSARRSSRSLPAPTGRRASSGRSSPASRAARRRCGSGTPSSCSPARRGSPSSSARREIVRRTRRRSARARSARSPPLGQPQQPGDDGHRPDDEQDLVPSALVATTDGGNAGGEEGVAHHTSWYGRHAELPD